MNFPKKLRSTNFLELCNERYLICLIYITIDIRHVIYIINILVVNIIYCQQKHFEIIILQDFNAII